MVGFYPRGESESGTLIAIQYMVPFSTVFFWVLFAKASGFNARFPTQHLYGLVQVMGDVDAGLQVALGVRV